MDEDAPPPPPDKPSQAPSWAMLGFVLGALFVLSLPHRKVEPAPAPAVQAAAPRPAPPRLTTIEAVFAEWGGMAVWSHDLTEVSLWNSDARAFTECFEVLRSGGAYYFRSIPHLTRPVLTHGVAENSPLEFTETPEQRQEWLSEKTKEDWRALGESLHHAPAPPPANEPGK